MSDEKPISPTPWTYNHIGDCVYAADRTIVCEDTGYADGQVIADAPAMLDLLRRREWGPDAGFCEECSAHEPEHNPGCAWGELIKKHGRG